MSSNEFGKIFKRAWGDTDFKRLATGEQLLYFKLISQPDISLAGVLTYAPNRWSGQTAGLSVADIERGCQALVAKDYIIVDLDTQEVLVRSYIRNDLGWRSPRTMVGVANAVGRVLSPLLRGVISRELTRLDTSSLSTVVNEKTNRSTREVVESAIRGVLDQFPPLDTVSRPALDGVFDTASEGVSEGVSATRPHTTANANAKATAGAGAGADLFCSSGADAPSKRASIDDEFADWYANYPRKVGKGQALKAYRAARKKVDHQTLVDRLTQQIPVITAQGAQYTPHPATWLNGERWADDDTVPQSARPDAGNEWAPEPVKPRHLFASDDDYRHYLERRGA